MLYPPAAQGVQSYARIFGRWCIVKSPTTGGTLVDTFHLIPSSEISQETPRLSPRIYKEILKDVDCGQGEKNGIILSFENVKHFLTCKDYQSLTES